MRLSVTSRRPVGVGQPPARLRGTMENGSTGQMRSSNPPPACGAACARVRRSRFELDLTERRTLPNRWAPECAFPSRRDRRMRLSVRVPAQNALFRRMRLSSPGQTWRRLTEKRILSPVPHGKAHSATYASRKSAVCNLRLTKRHTLRFPDRTDCAFPSRRGAREVWGNPPARLWGGLREGPQISVWA